jgi:CelD/BcsL family acetyltransferase involved in cellulose biosynthesis
VRQVDFGRGDDTYKRLWLSQCRQRRGVVAFNTTTARGLYGALRELVPTRLAAWRTARKRNLERSEG